MKFEGELNFTGTTLTLRFKEPNDPSSNGHAFPIEILLREFVGRMVRLEISDAPKKTDGLPLEYDDFPTEIVPEQLKTAQDDLETAFNEFWLSWPRKEGKQQALRVWKRIRPTTEQQAAIKLALKWQVPYWKGQAKDKLRPFQFAPHPQTYLNGERWRDEPPPAFKQFLVKDNKHDYGGNSQKFAV